MNLNKNYMSKYVIGKEYSYSTLKSMTKDELIKHLDIAQHNYECVNERLFNLTQYAEKLQKALDKACEELENLSCVKGLGQVGMCYAEWKEYLLKR